MYFTNDKISLQTFISIKKMLQFFAETIANGLELLAVGKTNDVILLETNCTLK